MGNGALDGLRPLAQRIYDAMTPGEWSSSEAVTLKTGISLEAEFQVITSLGDLIKRDLVVSRQPSPKARLEYRRLK